MIISRMYETLFFDDTGEDANLRNLKLLKCGEKKIERLITISKIERFEM